LFNELYSDKIKTALSKTKAKEETEKAVFSGKSIGRGATTGYIRCCKISPPPGGKKEGLS
jgi:hypothetical protein